MRGTKSRLEEILSWENPQERLKALIDHAHKLKINVHKAQDTNGVYSENELTVLIFDAESRRTRARNSNIGILALAVFISLAILGGIILMSYLMSSSRPGMGLTPGQGAM